MHLICKQDKVYLEDRVGVSISPFSFVYTPPACVLYAVFCVLYF